MTIAKTNMGGLGSTRWAFVSTKDTVESARSLDINSLNRAGCLSPGYRGSAADATQVRCGRHGRGLSRRSDPR